MRSASYVPDDMQQHINRNYAYKRLNRFHLCIILRRENSDEARKYSEAATSEAEGNPNTLGFLVFVSVATGTYTKQSDIDTLTVLRKNKPSSGLKNTAINGIKVGNMFFNYEILVQSIRTVPYLLHPLANAKLLFDRENTINPLLKEISTYFADNSEVRNKWLDYCKRFKQEKAQFGYEKTTIIDVWNELEKEYSGRSKRPFFNAFYSTNAIIFSLLKRFL